MEIKNVIERMLSVEKEARLQIAEAEKQAEQILDQSRHSGAEAVERRLRDARETAGKTVADAEHEARRRHQAAFEAGSKEIDARLVACRENKQRAIEHVRDALFGEPQNGKGI